MFIVENLNFITKEKIVEKKNQNNSNHKLHSIFRSENEKKTVNT